MRKKTTFTIKIDEDGITADTLFWQLLGTTATKFLLRRVAVYLAVQERPHSALVHIGKQVGLSAAMVRNILLSIGAVKRALTGGTVTTHNRGVWHVPAVRGRETRQLPTQQNE